MHGKALTIHNVNLGSEALGTHLEVGEALAFASFIVGVIIIVVALTIILDTKFELGPIVAHPDVYFAGFGMLGHIVDGLLVDKVNVLADSSRNRAIGIQAVSYTHLTLPTIA